MNELRLQALRGPDPTCLEGEAFHWPELLAHRFDPSLPEPAEWAVAEAHLEGCNTCRRQACALDPTLAFRNLPEISLGAADIEAMKSSVKVLRRSRKLLSEDLDEVAGHARRTRRERQYAWRATAAMALVVALGVMLSDLPQDPPEGVIPGASQAFDPAGVYDPSSGTGSVREASWLQPLDGLTRGVEADLPSLRDETPVVEEVENPAARIYHLRLPQTQQDEAVDVAWIIDPSLGG